jgi:hypothetical protein
MSRLLAKTEALNTWVYYRDGKEIARIEIMEENLSIKRLDLFRRKGEFIQVGKKPTESDHHLIISTDFNESLIMEKKMKNLKID